MRARALAFVAALLPALALAGAVASGVSPAPDATSGRMALYVDAAGNDANTCTAPGAGACATIQAALDKVPKRIRHPVSIDVGAGNFQGAIISSFQYEPEPSTTLVGPGTGLTIRGVMGGVTPATGLGSGTITSSATSAPGGHLVITDTGQSWTVNDLRGKFLASTAGAAADTYYPIESNDATTVTVAITSTSGFTAGTAYQVYEPTTVINAVPAKAPSYPTLTSAATATYLLYILESGSSYNPATVLLSRLSFSTAASAISARRAGLQIQNVSFSGLTGAGQSIIAADSSLTITRVAQVTANAGGASTSCRTVSHYSSVARGTISSSYIRGCNTFGVIAYASRIENVQTGSSGGWSAVRLMGSATTVDPQVYSLVIDCGSSSAYGISVGQTPSASGFTMTTLPSGATASLGANNDVSNCGTGVFVGPLSVVVTSAAVTGTSNTIGVSVREGGRYVQHASTTLTGSTADVQVDGANYTLANVRAAGGKRIVDANTGSNVVEP